MDELEIVYEPVTEAVDYEIIDNGKVVDTFTPSNQPLGANNVRSKEQIAQDILQKKLIELQQIRRFMKFSKRSAMLEEHRVAKTTRRRKKNKMAKASRKRNRS